MKKYAHSVMIAAVLMFSFAFVSPVPSLFAQEGEISAEEKAKLLSKAKERLESTIWEIDVTPMWGKKADRKSTRDKLTLVGGTLHSEAMKKDGYEDSNFTLMIGDDRAAVFETMQRNDKEAMVFWRVELTETDIRGVMSVQKPEEQPLSYSFRGAQTGVVEKEVPPPPPPVIEAPAEEAVVDAAAVPAVEGVPAAAAETVEAVESEAAAVSEKAPKKGFLNF